MENIAKTGSKSEDKSRDFDFDSEFEFKSSGGEAESVSESNTESRESSFSGSSYETLLKDRKAVGSSSPPLLGWPIRKTDICTKFLRNLSGDVKKNTILADSNKLKMTTPKLSDIDMMKERFGKLLLGEDMSGSGKGVCASLAISNAITNLCATVFGQLWRLEPLASEKKSMWLREMECLLCVSDHIVELIPSIQTFPDGTKLEVMTCRPRSDLFINLPALRKLDNMLIEVLESFTETEFWYVDQGIVTQESDGSTSFRKTIQRQEEKWWLPVPRVPPGGLTQDTRKQLILTRENTNQILKAAVAINNISLVEMEVPSSYLETLPKNGRSCLGDVIYRYITSDKFSAECLLDCLDLSSEHVALDIANRVEAAIYVWRRRGRSKPPLNSCRSGAKSSWKIMKELMVDGDKRELLAQRAQNLLICLKQRFPTLTQTSLDTTKIQSNKDVGKSILESYSRALESLAYNIVARIDDLLYVDDLTKQSDNNNLSTTVSVMTQKKVLVPYSVGTPYRTTFSTPSFSPAPLISPLRGERTPLASNDKLNRHGIGVRRALSNYLGGESKGRICGTPTEGASSKVQDSSTHQNSNKMHQSSPPTYTVS